MHKKDFIKTEAIYVEFTLPGNPQKNDFVGWGFATHHYQMCVKMNQLGLHRNIKIVILLECLATVNKL